LTSPSYWGSVSDKSIGIALANVNASKLKQISMPLPPLPEQHRIVAKIEELFTKLDTGVEALKKIQAQLKRYRQAVLKHAFEGMLTAEWPQAHQGELEPASILLERIKQERRKTAKGKYKELPPIDTSGLPQLPESWVWARVGDITDLFSGKAFKKREYSDEGVRLFQIANVSFVAVVWDSIAYMPVSYLQKYPELALKAGDILMALNRPILDGRLKIGELNEKDAPSILYQRVGRFDFYDSSLKTFFFYFAQTPFFIDRLKASLQGVDQPFVTKPKLLKIPMPIASLAEQHKIIEEVERRFSIADEIEKTIDYSLKQAERLRQSILKRAFEGKLVPQDPNDEPAEKLLEGIKAERAK